MCVCVVFQRATPHAGQHPSMCLYYYEKANSWESGHSKVYSNVHPEIIYMEVSRLYTAVCICISFHLNFSLSFSRIAVFSSCTVSKNKNRVRVVAWFFRSTCPYLSDFHVGPVFFFVVFVLLFLPFLSRFFTSVCLPERQISFSFDYRHKRRNIRDQQSLKSFDGYWRVPAVCAVS